MLSVKQENKIYLHNTGISPKIKGFKLKDKRNKSKQVSVPMCESIKVLIYYYDFALRWSRQIDLKIS